MNYDKAEKAKRLLVLNGLRIDAAYSCLNNVEDQNIYAVLEELVNTVANLNAVVEEILDEMTACE